MVEEKLYISVGELTKIIKMKFDNSNFFKKVYIKGEISNWKKQVPSGHCYFTVKDELSRINSVMFSQKSKGLTFEPKDGDSINIIGRISVYEPNGNYQLYVEQMSLDGEGELYQKYLQLKSELQKEGFFNQEIKKNIPKYPKKIGIVTASTGAAIKDILSTIKRRYPICETILFPSLVQGSDAAADITNKIKIANTYDIDTLIVGRGGGSIEDLWPFNERIVAEAIYNSKIPVISAVGHQVDFTIADFVADIRAATPTAAAELAVPNIEDVSLNIDNYINKININMKNKLENYRTTVEKIKNSYIMKNPLSIYEVKSNNIKNIKEKVTSIMKHIINDRKHEINIMKNSYIMKNPMVIYEKKNELLIKYIEKIELLNPMNSLKRGYAIIKKDGISVGSINKVKPNEDITINLSDGSVDAKVLKIKESL